MLYAVRLAKEALRFHNCFPIRKVGITERGNKWRVLKAFTKAERDSSPSRGEGVLWIVTDKSSGHAVRVKALNLTPRLLGARLHADQPELNVHVSQGSVTCVPSPML